MPFSLYFSLSISLTLTFSDMSHCLSVSVCLSLLSVDVTCDSVIRQTSVGGVGVWSPSKMKLPQPLKAVTDYPPPPPRLPP